MWLELLTEQILDTTGDRKDKEKRIAMFFDWTRDLEACDEAGHGA